jgi:hypothetical protein
MDALPFSLRVPGKDSITLTAISSTSFKFSGLLRLDGEVLHLEWEGSAQVEEVESLSVRDETVPLPEEELDLPLHELRSIALRGGWWRPRVELCARSLGALNIVPSEEGGQVALWIARRDRASAAALVESAVRALRSLGRRPARAEPITPYPTPSSGTS